MLLDITQDSHLVLLVRWVSIKTGKDRRLVSSVPPGSLLASLVQAQSKSVLQVCMCVFVYLSVIELNYVRVYKISAFGKTDEYFSLCAFSHVLIIMLAQKILL